MLPTIRSRCARLRLGPVGTRDIEAILAEAAAIDPPVAARVARICGGRPGVALAWVARPDALRERDAIGAHVAGSRVVRAPRTACPAFAPSLRRRRRSPASARVPTRRLDRPPRDAMLRPERRRRAASGPRRMRARPAPTAEAGEADAEEPRRRARRARRPPSGARPPRRSSACGRMSPATLRCASAASTGPPATSACSTRRTVARRAAGCRGRRGIPRSRSAGPGCSSRGNVSPELVLDDLASPGRRAAAEGHADPPPRSRRSDERLDATVRGRVQGVGFRYFVLPSHEPRARRAGSPTRPDGSRPLRRRGAARRPRTHCSQALEDGPAGGDRRPGRSTVGARPRAGSRSFEMRSGGHRGRLTG